MSRVDPVLIVGAGLSGLCCALALHKKNIPFVLLESSDTVGGRVKTDVVDGYLLDRGFQIFLTAYPEARRVLDYGRLGFKPFYPGAMVRSGSKFHLVSDPFRRPAHALETMMSPIGTIGDKLKIVSLRTGGKFASESETTSDALKAYGFSDEFIQQFFRPFFSGIFLEPKLETSAKIFEFVFQMLSQGENVIPSRGMQLIPLQIASRLPQEQIRLNCSVTEVEQRAVTLSSGERVTGSAVVLATEESVTRLLLGQEPLASYNSQTCLYFSAPKPPFTEPMLVLNGEPTGIVNNFCIPSNVSRLYAPRGKSLMSVSLIGNHETSDAALRDTVISELRGWYGNQVDTWELLRIYRIKYSLPDQRPAALASKNIEYKNSQDIFTCGDYRETGSINGAMVSGRKAAEAVLSELLVSV